MAFDAWMKKVDAEVSRKVGLSVHDLPDCCFSDWHEDGVTPKSAASRAIKYAKEG